MDLRTDDIAAALEGKPITFRGYTGSRGKGVVFTLDYPMGYNWDQNRNVEENFKDLIERELGPLRKLLKRVSDIGLVCAVDGQALLVGYVDMRSKLKRTNIHLRNVADMPPMPEVLNTGDVGEEVQNLVAKTEEFVRS